MTSMASQVFTVLFGRGLIRIAQLITFVLLARTLSASAFGWFGILTSAVALAATLGSLGLRQSFAYWIGQRRITQASAVATALLLWIPLSAASAVVVYLVSGADLPIGSQVISALIVFTSMAGLILITLLQGVHLGRGDIRAFTLGDTLPRVFLLAGIAVLAFSRFMTLESSLWAQAICYLLTVPVALWFATRSNTAAYRPEIGRVPGMLRYGIFFALNLFLITLCSRLSMFVIQYFDGADAAGQFYAAVRVNEIFLEASTALSMVVFSRTARHEDGRSLLTDSAKMAAWLFWGFLVIAALIAIGAPLLVEVVLGHRYAAAAPALQVLGLCLAPTAASKVVYSTVAGAGRPAFGTPVIAVSLAVNFIAAWLLVPVAGVTGGAVALVVGQVVLLLGYAFLLRARYRIPVRTFFLPEREDMMATYAGVRRRSLGLLHRLAPR